jgi:serine/threonine-protein kinase
MEDFFGPMQGAESEVLFEELLKLDLDYRQRRGELPDAAVYRSRFPEFAGLVDDVLRELFDLLVILHVIIGPHKGRRFVFSGHDNFIVGRSPDAHFRLPEKDPYFSRLHFLVEVNPPRCRLVDLDSLNHTFVNGIMVDSAQLREGDLIQGGETVIQVSLVRPAIGGGDEGAGVDQAGSVLAGDSPADLEDTTSLPEDAHVGGPTHPGRHTPAPRSGSTKPPSSIAGYEIVEELGRGGMGVVYRALRPSDGLDVAIKTIHPAVVAGEREVQRFLREAQILCTLRHPNIVGFHQMGREGDLFYIVMDYVRGEDAKKLLEEQRRLPAARAVRLVCDVLEALQYAHGHRFVHRDVKPANMLVAESGRAEVCRLADFGLARVYHATKLSGLTVLGNVGGTVPYMAPEQITNYRDARPPADQYATAATLYHLLSGCYTHDFDEERGEQQLKNILVRQPVPIAERCGHIPSGLSAAIHRALAKDPTRRFPNVAAFREALQPFRGDP